jgi:hypothetical protein
LGFVVRDELGGFLFFAPDFTAVSGSAKAVDGACSKKRHVILSAVFGAKNLQSPSAVVRAMRKRWRFFAALRMTFLDGIRLRRILLGTRRSERLTFPTVHRRRESAPDFDDEYEHDYEGIA